MAAARSSLRCAWRRRSAPARGRACSRTRATAAADLGTAMRRRAASRSSGRRRATARRSRARCRCGRSSRRRRFRSPLELAMHRAAVARVMPIALSYGGCNFDIVTGVAAIVRRRARRRRSAPGSRARVERHRARRVSASSSSSPPARCRAIFSPATCPTRGSATCRSSGCRRCSCPRRSPATCWCFARSLFRRRAAGAA